MDKMNEKKIHIVITCRGCDSGGSVPNIAIKQACVLQKYFTVSLVSDGFPDNIFGINKELVNPWKFNYLRRFCHVPNEYSFVRSVLLCLPGLHQKNRIDMIICNSHALASLAALRVKRKYGIPYALVTHGDIFERPKGTYDVLLTAFYKMVTPSAYRNADLVIASSPHMASRAIMGGAAKEAIAVIPNGFDPIDIGLDGPVFSKDSIFRNSNSPIKLLFVGRFSIEKGADILIKACKILADYNISFELNMIGSGPSEYNLQKLVKEMGLERQVKFLGKIERKILGKCYSQADLLCIPSISEPLPSVAIEGLMSGVPVLGSNVGGIPFIVQEGKNGILVDPGSPEAIAREIESLVNNPLRLQTLTNNAALSVYPRFTGESVGRKLRDSIQKVVFAKSLTNNCG
jgi:glycosyltransferase involved in cell wall biosynthesis